MDQLKARYWRPRNARGGLSWPSPWSAFPDARARARAAGDEWEERYVRYFSVLSWHVHSGLVGVQGIRRELFDIFACQAHELSTAVILDCYGIAGSEIQLENAIAEWRHQQEFLRHVSGIALLDEKLMTLGEPSRFFYLEPHEREPD